MKKLKVKIHVNESLTVSDSIIRVFYQDQWLCELSGEETEFEIILETEEHAVLMIKREYLEPPVERNLFTRLFWGIFSLVLLLVEGMEAFECPFECQETFYLDLDDDTAEVEISCVKQKWTVFKTRVSGCRIHSEKVIMPSVKEAEEIYHGRKKGLLFCMILPLVLTVLALITLRRPDATATVFLFVILGIIVVGMILAFAKMKRQYLLMISQEPMEWKN